MTEPTSKAIRDTALCTALVGIVALCADCQKASDKECVKLKIAQYQFDHRKQKVDE